MTTNEGQTRRLEIKRQLHEIVEGKVVAGDPAATEARLLDELTSSNGRLGQVDFRGQAGDERPGAVWYSCRWQVWAVGPAISSGRIRRLLHWNSRGSSCSSNRTGNRPGRRRIVVTTFGSLGDLHPCIAIALGLQVEAMKPSLPPAATTGRRSRRLESVSGLFGPDHPDLEADPDLARRTMDRRKAANTSSVNS